MFLKSQTLNFSFSSDSIYPGDTLIITNTSLGLPDSAVYIFSFANRNLTHPHQGDSAYESLSQIGKKSFSLIPINSGFFTVSLKMQDTNLTSQIFQKNYYVYNKSIGCYNPFGNCNVITNTCFTAAGVNPAEWGMGNLFHAACWDNASLVGNVGSWYPGADYYNMVSTNMDFKIPYNNWVGPQDKVCGSTMAGFVAYMQDNILAPIPNSNDYNRNYREYPSIMIVNPNLIPGQRYHAQMDVSLAENSKIAVQNIGMYFGWSAQQSIRMDGNLVIPQIIPRTPQIVSQNIISNTTGWTRIEGDFVSTGGNCLHIGNFSDDANTNIQVLNGSQTIGGQYAAYYFLDNVRLIPIHENTSETITYCHTSNVTISTKLHVDLRNTFLWSTGATTASITVNPTTPTTYSVTATDVYGCTKVDSYNIIPAYEPVVPVLSGNLNTCEQISTYTITNEQPNTIYTWVPTNYTTMTGSNATKTITWDIANFPVQPNYATITITSNNGCQSSNVYKVWECCRKNQEPLINGETITNSLSYEDYYLNGTITLDGNLTFNYINFWMGPEAKINVTPNSNITFNHSTIASACFYMWEGLNLNPSSSLTMDNCYVNDAVNGIVSNGGASFNIANTLFNRNLYGIVVNSYTSTHNGVVSKCAFYSMDNNPLIASNLLNPYSNRRSIAGIKITDVNNIQIGNTVSTSNNNVFKHMDYGVMIDNSNVTLYNNSFGPMPNTTGSSMPENGYGIYAINGNVNGNTINIGNTSTNAVYANSFSDCAIGVYAVNNYNINIYRNTFTSPTQIMRFGTFMMEHGYRTINISNNKFTNPTAIGVWALNIPYASINIDDNKFYNNIAGANETQMNIAVNNIVLSKITSVNIRGNYMYNDRTNGLFQTGILLSNLEGYTDLALNKHYPFVFGNTISYSTAINIIDVSTKRCGIRVENCRNANVEQNTISCAKVINNDLQNASIASRLTGIYVITSPNTVLCKNIVDHRGFGIQFDGNSSSSRIIRNDLTNNFYGYEFSSATIGNQNLNSSPHDNKWISFATAQRRAHGTLATSTSWLYRTTNTDYRLQSITDYSINNLNTSTSSSSYINDCGYTSGGGGMSMIAGSSTENIESQEAEYFIDQVENEYYDRFNNAELLSINNQTNSEVTYENDLFSNILLFKSVNKYISSRDHDMAYSVNNSINPINMIEQNMKTVNDIYLRTWAKGNWNITSSDYFTLIDIALQSPITSGFGVVSAWIMTQRFDNKNELVESQKAIIKIKQNSNIVISPNPAKDQIQIDGIAQISKISIYDVFGREMFSNLNDEKNSIIINISSLKKGIYFVLFTNKFNGDVSVEKIVIL